jgi:uncharacterized protein
MTNYLPAFIGGLMIGLAALLLMLFNGKIAGISGILQGVFWQSKTTERVWRLCFIIGIILGSFLFSLSSLFDQQTRLDFPLWLLALSGLLVGIGTSIGNGCTSGHGVCGIGRLSMRSLIATISFILSASITLYIVRYLLGAE